jgi:hypothetical protein
VNKYIKQLVFVCDIYVVHGMRARGLVLRVLVYVAIFSVMTKNTHVSAFMPYVAMGAAVAVDALIKAFGPCAIDQEKRQTSPGIWTCRNCLHGMHNPDGEGQCEFCPPTTIVTDDKYGNICELDCGVAFSEMLGMDHKQVDLYIMSFPNVPCVKNRDPESKWNSAGCKSDDDSWAQNSVVRWEVPVRIIGPRVGIGTQFSIISPAEAATPGNADFPTGAEFGNKHRVCDLCPKGTYRDVADRKSCQKCPGGFVGARPLQDDTSLFIPVDVKTATEISLVSQTSPPGNYFVFGCRACSVSEGILDSTGNCAQCKDTEYQHAEQVQFQHPTGGLLKYQVGVKCATCRPGYEFFNRGASNRKTPCRSALHEECCRPCKENQYSPGGVQCKDVPETEVGVNVTTSSPVAFGASGYRLCAGGEELVYCANAQCDVPSQTKRFGWRSCKKCALSETKKTLSPTLAGCQECADEGEQYRNNKIPTECTHCSLCDGLDVKPSSISLYQIPPDIINLPDINLKLSDESGNYWTTQKTAICLPLKRRTVAKEGTPVGFQEYRKTTKDPTAYPVPAFHTVFRESGTCVMKECSQVCVGEFTYSPGCGPQIQTPAALWVSDGKNVVALNSALGLVSHANILWYVSHGPCTLCLTCPKGYYNDGCNVHRGDVNPKGVCKPCNTGCGADQYMHHRDGDGGCDFPLPSKQHTDSQWKVNSNYECKKCPYWVLETKDSVSFMHTVTACGTREEYKALHFDSDNNVGITTKSIVEWSDGEGDQTKFGPDWKKYRSFMRDLHPYCPILYFYDTSIPGCNLNALLEYEHETYTVPNTIPPASVTLGFRPHNPACCIPCRTPNQLMLKRGSDWQQCRGDTTEDVQNDYVDKCGRGYYEDVEVANGVNTTRCNKCSTCHEGILFDMQDRVAANVGM